VTCEKKLAQWASDRHGRVAGAPKRVNVNAVALECDCTEDGELVVRGVGPTAEAAIKNACDKLWAQALRSAGEPTDPVVPWSRR
jgi:hypothetical protein